MKRSLNSTVARIVLSLFLAHTETEKGASHIAVCIIIFSKLDFCNKNFLAYLPKTEIKPLTSIMQYDQKPAWLDKRRNALFSLYNG
jgi:hypothetical protein